MSNCDVPSEILADSAKEFIGTWWDNMCALLGVHQSVPESTIIKLSLLNELEEFLSTSRETSWLLKKTTIGRRQFTVS